MTFVVLVDPIVFGSVITNVVEKLKLIEINNSVKNLINSLYNFN